MSGFASIMLGIYFFTHSIRQSEANLYFAVGILLCIVGSLMMSIRSSGGEDDE